MTPDPNPITPCPSCQSISPNHHFADCVAGAEMEVTSTDRKKYALRTDLNGDKTGKAGTRYWELIGVGGTDEHDTKFKDAFGTPRDSELAEDFYLIVKVGVLFALGALALGFLMEIGRAIAGVVMG